MITIQAGYALVIDDEPANRDFLERLLQTASFKVTGAATGAEGLRAARNMPALSLALVDQQLPDATGLEIIAKLRAENPEALLVMATMHDDRNLIDQAFEIGTDVFLVKPHGFMELYRRLQEVDSDTTLLRRLVIDQYGPRPYRSRKSAPQEPNSLAGSSTGHKPDELVKPVAVVATDSAKVSGTSLPGNPAASPQAAGATGPKETLPEKHAVGPTDPTAPSRSGLNNPNNHKDVTLIHRPRLQD